MREKSNYDLTSSADTKMVLERISKVYVNVFEIHLINGFLCLHKQDAKIIP